MDADYARLEWAWQQAESHLTGVSSGLASAARSRNLDLIQEWADRWDAQHEKVQAAHRELMAYTNQKWEASDG